ncbi:MAG: FISUMP domain-containing protein [Candidatus Saccharibacteria bacterium]|nr:FISUMP domain-containing protein [Candidatus Saccharibacteria bacterium]
MKQKTITNIITIFSLTIVGFIASIPFSTTQVFADSAISLTVSSNSLSLDLAPATAVGTFSKSSTLDISVTFSGTGGYTLGIHSATTGTDSTKLVNTTDNTKSFTSIHSAISESDFSSSSNTQYNSKWGYLPSKYYSIDNTSFRPAPDEAGDILDKTNGTNETNTYTIAIGARANNETTAGSYTGTYVITAIATQSCNPLATTINEALCMQDLSGDNPNADAIINSIVEGRQYILKDNRDWKEYYIAKMKDGRVWMTQNLDLDLETAPTNVAALTHANTDLGWTTLNASATWTPSTTTATTAADYGANTNITPASFDYGDVYRYTSTTGTTTTYSTKSACETAHNDGTCPHYHLGNYYNWSAAVASNNTSSFTTNYSTAPNSICPAGWRLPTGRTSNTIANPGYYSEINYTWVNEGIAQDYVADTGTATYATKGWINIRNNPMYMVAAGYKDGTSTPTQLGTYGRYWTSTVYNNSVAYAPYFYSPNLYPAYYNSTQSQRGRGFSIRCVARQTNTGSTVVTFDKNANDATGNMNSQTYNANTINTLPANGFSRLGYVFNSWNTEPDGSGITYADAAKYYARTGTATTTVTLYAQWDKLYTITFNISSNVTGISFDGTTYTNNQTTQATIGSEHQISGLFPTKYGINTWSATAGTIANLSAPTTTYIVAGDAIITVTSIEATTSITSLTAPTDPVSSNCVNEAVVPQLVYDPRDNEAYYVARLCDGNIWMLDNLRLDLTNSTVINSLSSTNTNATDIQLYYLKNGGGSTTDQYPTSGLSGSEWTSGWSNSVPQVVSGYKNDIAPITFGLGSGKVGVYYNYCATSAGSFCWEYNSHAPSSDPVPNSYYDIEGDICPAGWHLPSGTISGHEYALLEDAYQYGGTLGGDTILSHDMAHHNSLSTPLSGRVSYGGSSSQSSLGSSGIFWSSTWATASDMYHYVALETSSGGNDSQRSMGNSIRCMLNDV